MNGFLISAPQSGSGKTTVSLAIMSGLVRRGFTVKPFKCGPDFIDPGYHRLVAGAATINLDGWMTSKAFVCDTFLGSMAESTDQAGLKIAVIEGAMGLFDGIGASGRNGSSAEIAVMTGAPVVIVVDARGMAASAAALVKGFSLFDPEVSLAGVIFNNVGSSTHAELLRKVMEDNLPDIKVFGCIPRDESFEIPSRHLGLVTAEDNPLSDEFIRRLAEMAERCLDLDRLAALEMNPPSTGVYSPLSEGDKSDEGVVRVAIARDSAFCFMYEDNLRLLREAGAEPVFFSPLEDTALPADIKGLYLPGGYPELYAERLAANFGMLESIRAAVTAEMPVYAECGGFIYLTEGLITSDGHVGANLVGIFPVRSRMLARRKALGYRRVELLTETSFGARGTLCRGHEFHYSETAAMPDEIERCYKLSRQGSELGLEGYRVRNCIASYIHLHFGSNPKIAAAFVESCRHSK